MQQAQYAGYHLQNAHLQAEPGAVNDWSGSNAMQPAHLSAGTLASTAHTGAELPPAGLLHDTVEDTQDHSTPASFEQIELTFGKAVRRIVEGETRFSKISKVGCCHALPGDLWGLLLQLHCARVSVEIKVSTVCLTTWPAVVGAHASFHCTSDCRGNLQLLQDQRDGLCWLVRGSAVCGSSAKMCLRFRWHAAMVLEAHHLCASSFACMQYWRRLQGGLHVCCLCALQWRDSKKCMSAVSFGNDVL